MKKNPGETVIDYYSERSIWRIWVDDVFDVL